MSYFRGNPATLTPGGGAANQSAARALSRHGGTRHVPRIVRPEASDPA